MLHNGKFNCYSRIILTIFIISILFSVVQPQNIDSRFSKENNSVIHDSSDKIESLSQNVGNYSSADATSLSLTSGSTMYYFIGSSGGKAINSYSWSSSLDVVDYFSNDAISIGEQTSNSGSFSTSAGTYSIAGVGVTYVKSPILFTGSNGTNSAYGTSLSVPFNTTNNSLVLIMVGGQGDGFINLSGFSYTTLVNHTSGSAVLASGAIFYANLQKGNYSANITSGTNGANSGASIGVAIYVFPEVPTQGNVTFETFGLPNQTAWSINIQGTNYNTVSSNLTLNFPNGNYNYQVISPQNFTLYPDQGSFVVAGNNLSIDCYFVPLKNIYGVINPRNIAFDARNNYFYITDQGNNNSVTVLDGYQSTIIANIKLFAQPFDIIYDPANNLIYLDYSNSENITVLNPTTNSIVKNFNPGEYQPGFFAFDPANNNVYLANDQSVTVLSSATSSVSTVIPLAAGLSGVGITYDSNNQYLFVSDNNGVVVINGTSNTVVQTVSYSTPFPPVTMLAYDSSNNYIYAPSTGQTIDVIDGNSFNLVNQITTGSVASGPTGVSFDSAHNYVYVTNDRLGNITVIDGNSNSVINTINLVGGSKYYPQGITFDSLNNYTYVVNGDNDSISIITNPFYPPVVQNSVTTASQPDGTTTGQLTGGAQSNPTSNNLNVNLLSNFNSLIKILSNPIYLLILVIIVFIIFVVPFIYSKRGKIKNYLKITKSNFSNNKIPYDILKSTKSPNLYSIPAESGYFDNVYSELKEYLSHNIQNSTQTLEFSMTNLQLHIVFNFDEIKFVWATNPILTNNIGITFIQNNRMRILHASITEKIITLELNTSNFSIATLINNPIDALVFAPTITEADGVLYDIDKLNYFSIIIPEDFNNETLMETISPSIIQMLNMSTVQYFSSINSLNTISKIQIRWIRGENIDDFQNWLVCLDGNNKGLKCTSKAEDGQSFEFLNSVGRSKKIFNKIRPKFLALGFTNAERSFSIKGIDNEDTTPFIDLSLVLIGLREFSQLGSLELSGLKLREIPSLFYELNEKLTNLQTLSLKDNYLTSEQIKKNIPLNPALITLDLENNLLQEIPNYQNLSNIEEIKLKDNPILISYREAITLQDFQKYKFSIKIIHFKNKSNQPNENIYTDLNEKYLNNNSLTVVFTFNDSKEFFSTFITNPNAHDILNTTDEEPKNEKLYFESTASKAKFKKKLNRYIPQQDSQKGVNSLLISNKTEQLKTYHYQGSTLKSAFANILSFGLYCLLFVAFYIEFLNINFLNFTFMHIHIPLLNLFIFFFLLFEFYQGLTIEQYADSIISRLEAPAILIGQPGLINRARTSFPAIVIIVWFITINSFSKHNLHHFILNLPFSNLDIIYSILNVFLLFYTNVISFSTLYVPYNWISFFIQWLLIFTQSFAILEIFWEIHNEGWKHMRSFIKLRNTENSDQNENIFMKKAPSVFKIKSLLSLIPLGVGLIFAGMVIYIKNTAYSSYPSFLIQLGLLVGGIIYVFVNRNSTITSMIMTVIWVLLGLKLLPFVYITIINSNTAISIVNIIIACLIIAYWWISIDIKIIRFKPTIFSILGKPLDNQIPTSEFYKFWNTMNKKMHLSDENQFDLISIIGITLFYVIIPLIIFGALIFSQLILYLSVIITILSIPSAILVLKYQSNARIIKKYSSIQ